MTATVSVESLAAGADQNVQSGQLVEIVSAIAGGPDLVTNEQPITSGLDAESDQAFRERFVLYINSLSKGTTKAIETAVRNLQNGLDLKVLSNKDINNNDLPGTVTIILDDGSGTPSAELLANALSAAEQVRAAAIQVFIVAPNKVDIAVALSIRTTPTANTAEVQSAVSAAIVDYVNTLKIGDTLYLSSLMDVALAVSDVVSVQPNSLKINTLEADKEVDETEVIKTVNSSVAVGTY